MFRSWAGPTPCCPAGLLDGYWKRLNAKGGIFGGKWATLDGKVHGKLAGIWGKKKNGDRVVYGIYVAAGKKFGGITKGTYEPFPESAALDVDAGVFKAKWIGKAKVHKGVLAGVYGPSPDAEGSRQEPSSRFWAWGPGIGVSRRGAS